MNPIRLYPEDRYLILIGLALVLIFLIALL